MDPRAAFERSRSDANTDRMHLFLFYLPPRAGLGVFTSITQLIGTEDEKVHPPAECRQATGCYKQDGTHKGGLHFKAGNYLQKIGTKEGSQYGQPVCLHASLPLKAQSFSLYWALSVNFATVCST